MKIFIKPLTDDDLMPFGVHKGKPLSEVPDEYLLWIYQNYSLESRLRLYIQNNYDAILLNVKNNSKDADESISGI